MREEHAINHPYSINWVYVCKYVLDFPLGQLRINKSNHNAMWELTDRRLLVPKYFIYFVCNSFNEFDSTSMFMGNMCGYHVLYWINCLFEHLILGLIEALCFEWAVSYFYSWNKQGDRNLKSMIMTSTPLDLNNQLYVQWLN